jgi:hypothetical protein
MSNNDYDDDFDNVERGMMDEQESDDFANFDPKRYLERRNSGALVGDDRDEVELGVDRRSRRRSVSVDEDDAVSSRAASRTRTTSSRRTRTSDRYRTQNMESPKGGGLMSGAYEMLTNLLVSGAITPFARPLILGFGCLVVFACIALLAIGLWFLNMPRG